MFDNAEMMLLWWIKMKIGKRKNLSAKRDIVMYVCDCEITSCNKGSCSRNVFLYLQTLLTYMSAGGPFKPRLGTHCVGRRKEEKLAANLNQIIMQQVAPGSCATLYILEVEMNLRKVENCIIKERAFSWLKVPLML